MVTFDAGVAGTPVTAWDDARLRRAPTLDTEGCTGLVVIVAHPDDETLGAAGLMAGFARRGLPVHVVMVTDGAAAGTPGIAAIRSHELRDAVSVVAPSARISELGFPDAAALHHRGEIAERLRAVIDETDAGTLLVSTWSGDGHADHEVVGELVAELAAGRRVVAAPIWLWHWGDPSDAELPWSRFRTFAADVDKSRAIRAHRTQVEGDAPMLRPEMLAHFLTGREIFIELERPGDATLDTAYFDGLYEGDDDPWSFLTRWYEERKRAVTVASLARPRYGAALEIGCSIGVLTAELGPRCDSLLAVDVSTAAVERARVRLGEAGREPGSVRVERLDVSAGFPSGPFDLIVLSEVGYYFSEDRLDGVLASARDALSAEGELLACHWRHPVDDYPLSGDEVHARLGDLGLSRRVRHEEADFVLEVFSRDPRSVAQLEGLA